MGMTKNHNVLDYCAPGDIDDDSQYTLAGDIFQGGRGGIVREKKRSGDFCVFEEEEKEEDDDWEAKVG